HSMSQQFRLDYTCSTHVYAPSLHDALPIYGRNPAGGGYIPRFRNLHKQETDFLRGYAAGFGAYRSSWSDESGLGADLKGSILTPKYGNWGVGSHIDRKSTRLNSSHVKNSYAVFCLKTK